MEKTKITYKGHDIVINFERFDFFVTGPMAEGREGPLCYPSRNLAEEAIDKFDKLQASKQFTEKVELEVWDEEGSPATITGINRHTKGIKGIAKEKCHPCPIVYPNVPWIQKTLKQIKELKRMTQELREKVNPYELKSSWGYGRVDDPVEYGHIMTELKNDYKRKKEKAQITFREKSS